MVWTPMQVEVEGGLPRWSALLWAQWAPLRVREGSGAHQDVLCLALTALVALGWVGLICCSKVKALKGVNTFLAKKK